MQGRGRKRERERERILSRLCTDRAEPDMGIEPMNREIKTRAGIKSRATYFSGTRVSKHLKENPRSKGRNRNHEDGWRAYQTSLKN